MLTRMRMALARFMQGRNGVDNLGYHCMWAGLILVLVNLFIGSGVLGIVTWVLYIYAIFRMLSRNVGKRRLENTRYVQFTMKIGKEVKQFFLRLKGMKEYKYFRCPGCRNRLRMKRGSGLKHVTCRVCGHQFDQKA